MKKQVRPTTDYYADSRGLSMCALALDAISHSVI